MKRRHRRLAVPLMIAMLSIAGCARHDQPAAPADPRPAQVESIDGSDLHRVTLTEQAMDRLGVQTEPVKAAPPAVPAQPAAVASTVIPVSAVIYDPQGHSWTYTVSDQRTFTRQAIVIDHIAGTSAFLRSGPTVGTPVVTVGAPELLGAEYGVGEE
jgi:hypothetical protein